MTDLAVPAWMQPSLVPTVEHWHATVMAGGLIASVVVARGGDGSGSDGCWTARTQLRDRSLWLMGECRKSGPFATHEAALAAGQAAAWRLHKAVVGMRKVPEPAFVLPQQPGGYQSQALRRFARVQQAAQAKPSVPSVAQAAAEAEEEMFA